MNWATRIDTIVNTMYTLPCTQQVTNGNLRHSTGSSTQGSAVTCMGREPKGREGVFIPKAPPLLYSRNTHDAVQQRSSTRFQVL